MMNLVKFFVFLVVVVMAVEAKLHKVRRMTNYSLEQSNSS